MVQPHAPDPVKLFIAVLSNQHLILAELEDYLVRIFGSIDYRSVEIPFEHTDYYEKEMGPNLFRYFISFSKLIDPGDLAIIKLQTNEIEQEFACDGKRRVNLDSGYLDYHKVVLASGKFGGPKIFIAKGIYADMTLRYSFGKFEPLDWAFPDFKTGAYNEIFSEIRQLYKQTLRQK